MADLTNAQIQAIRDSWDLVLPNKKQLGVEFFLQFFADNPKYQDLFSKLKGMSAEELKTSPKMRAHATLVFHSLTALVQNLDDPECLVQLITKIAADHYPRGIRVSHYANLGKTLLAFLEDKLGKKFDPMTKSSWEAVLGAIVSVVKATTGE